MSTKVILTLCLILSVCQVLGDLDDYDDPPNVKTVSTTQRPSETTQQNEEIISEMEKRINAKFNDIGQKLEDLQRTVYAVQVNCVSSQLQHNEIHMNLPKSCKDVKNRGNNVSSIYVIKPKLSPNVMAVWCDMENKGGGWTYILNRFDGSQSFDFDWKEYKEGFGQFYGESWLGLDNIHYLTGSEPNELVIELVDWNKKNVFAHYDSFSVGSEDEGYIIKVVSGYSGTLEDYFSYSANMKFSTKSRDQDASSSTDCVKIFGGGWWYKSCVRCLLTGTYTKASAYGPKHGRISYCAVLPGRLNGVEEARMMVRPKD